MIVKILVWVLLIITTCLIVFGLIYRPPASQFFIDSGRKPGNPVCLQTPITCNTDDDCDICIDNQKLSCVDVSRNPDQESLYGKSGKYCLPKLPDQPCNLKNGGIWTWTGWASTDRMGWDCLCTYPGISGNPGCTQLNPNVCVGGTWSYDATTASTPPSANFCKCQDNSQLVSTKPANIPMCVPKGDWTCKTPTMCGSMYSNTDIITT